MRPFLMACAWALALATGCAGGESDDGPMWFPPNVPAEDDDRDDGGDDGDEGNEGDFDGSTGGEDAGDPAEGETGGAAPGDEGGAAPGTDDGGQAPADDGGNQPPPPPADDDGGQPPPPPPPPPAGDLDAQCQDFCGALTFCEILEDSATAMQDCVSGCAAPESAACDAAWSQVMTCVTGLDCFQMLVWNVGLPGYPCEAEEQTYGMCV